MRRTRWKEVSKAGSLQVPRYTSARRRRAQEVIHTPIRARNKNADLYYVRSTVSTGIRFTTFPDTTPELESESHPSPPSSSSSTSNPSPSSATTSASPGFEPPTTITALFNPMMGHMSGAYTAQVSRDLSLSTRFDFNVYSYESEWTMGAEWWLRRSRSKPGFNGTMIDDTSALPSSSLFSEALTSPHGVTGVVKARASTSNVSTFFHMSSCSEGHKPRRTLRYSGRAG